MQDLIDKFFIKHLSLSPEDALMLHHKYYKDYGLAIQGLVKYHKIDPLEFNREVDDALPLDDVLSPDPQLRALLEDIDKTKVKMWLFTNAHITHAKRVVQLLGVDDLFEGLTYCDYEAQELICKPRMEMFEKAEREARVQNVADCYFVDDSYLNCTHAQARGWTTVHLVEPGVPPPAEPASQHQITNLEQLRLLFAQFFKSPSSTAESTPK